MQETVTRYTLQSILKQRNRRVFFPGTQRFICLSFGFKWQALVLIALNLRVGLVDLVSLCCLVNWLFKCIVHKVNSKSLE
jgi:hypothetical protein